MPGDEKKYMLVCPNCLSPVKSIIFSSAVAVNFGAMNSYACSNCGRTVQPVEVDAEKLNEIAKKKVMRK